MDATRLKAIINKYGVDKLLGFRMDNNRRHLFVGDKAIPFSWDIIDEETDTLVLRFRNQTYIGLGPMCTQITPIEDIQGVLFVDDVNDKDKVELRDISH